MSEFLRPDTNRPTDFPSGVVSVPMVVKGGAYEDTGILVAGTAGYTIEESTYNRPSVKAEHGWGLLLPKDSPMTPIINHNHCTTEEVTLNNVRFDAAVMAFSRFKMNSTWGEHSYSATGYYNLHLLTKNDYKQYAQRTK